MYLSHLIVLILIHHKLYILLNIVLGERNMFEVIIGFLIVVVVGYLGYLVYSKDRATSTNKAGKTDLNKDGKTNVEDAKVALDRVVQKVVEKVDVNKDGKISVADAEVVMDKVKENIRKNIKKSETVQTAAPQAETKPAKRARNKGKFVGDNKQTADMNEAWIDGKAPEKKVTDPAKKKPRKPKMTVAK